MHALGTATGHEPIPLYVFVQKGATSGYKVSAFACGKCKTVAASPLQFIGSEDEQDAAAKAQAARHCGPWFCACGSEMGQFRTKCDACGRADSDRRIAEREAQALAKAKRVDLDDYGGEMLYDGDQYRSPDEVRDMIEDGDAPEYMWGCSERGFELDASRIIEDALESDEHHEEAAHQLEKGAEKALQETLAEWSAKYAPHVRSYFPNYSVAVYLPTLRVGEESGR